MFKKLDLVSTIFAVAGLFLASGVAWAQDSARPAPSPAPTAAPTTGPGSTPRPKITANTIGPANEQVNGFSAEVPKTEGRSVLVWIKDGTIVAFGLAKDYNDKSLLADAYQARARSRGNKLLLEFLAPLSREKNSELKTANLLKFGEGSFDAFNGSCGIAKGTYKVENARSRTPTVEIALQQMSAHRRRRSRNRDECDPFGRGSIF